MSTEVPKSDVYVHVNPYTAEEFDAESECQYGYCIRCRSVYQSGKGEKLPVAECENCSLLPVEPKIQTQLVYTSCARFRARSEFVRRVVADLGNGSTPAAVGTVTLRDRVRASAAEVARKARLPEDPSAGQKIRYVLKNPRAEKRHERRCWNGRY